MAHPATLRLTRTGRHSLKLRLLYAIFAFSGASSLVLETIFTRLLTYTFGNTAHAVSTVLAAFLGGLAVGAYVLGRFSNRYAASLRWYAVLEMLIGLYCLAVPWLFARLTAVYVAAYYSWQPGPVSLLVLRFGLASIPILIPSFLMGGTLPVLVRYVVATDLGSEAEINRLYGWNTLGAALGALIATYLLIPLLGVNETIWTACATDLAIATCAWLMAVRDANAPDLAPSTRATSNSTSSHLWLHVLAFLTGAAALGYEVVWSHVQAFTIGNTVYAFGSMLFAVLCGLGLGAQLVSRRLRDEQLWAPALCVSQLVLGAVVFATVPLWGRMNYVFEHSIRAALLTGVVGLFAFRIIWIRVTRQTQQRPAESRTRLAVSALLSLLLVASGVLLLRSGNANFVVTEVIRLFCCFYLLIIPALLLGMSFPLLLSMGKSGREETAASSVGAVYAANTLGAITGSVLIGFVVLPRLGSEMTLRALAAFNLLLGLVVSFTLLSIPQTRKFMLAGSTCAFVLAGWFALPHWDLRTLLRGSYVYFQPAQTVDRVLYAGEDVQGGMTSVVETGGTRTLLSNAKFQGDNGEQISAQIRFALIPAVLAQHYQRALVIGLGTGQTLRVVSLFPFQHIDVAELAPQIVDASRKWFSDVNGGVLQHDPRVSLNIVDGRNFLLLSRARYDLITVEITSIWISGEADLYNREFYQLCRDHLAEGGVLQQWVQLHDMRRNDLLTIFNTAARVFPYSAFFVDPVQGVLLASPSPLSFDVARSEDFDRNPQIHLQTQRLGIPSVASFLGQIMLYGDSMHKAISFLPDGGGPRSRFISTDSHPYLEYATPKGNVLAYDATRANYKFLLALRPSQLPADLHLLNVPSEDERNLILGYASEERGDAAAALRYFGAVQGPTRKRAQLEIARLNAKLRR